jgi:uncharacterized protein (UPF0335 family)
MGDEGHSKTLLVGFINRVKRLADEIADLQSDTADVCKEAKDAGFEPKRIREVVKWLRQIEKHGRDKVDEAEAIFDLYRQVVDGRAANFDDMMDSARDRALLAKFAPTDQVAPQINQRTKKMKEALAMAQAAKKARAS